MPVNPDLKTFESGAVRSNEAEGFRYDLISPIGLRRLAARHKLGEAKGYADFNWEKGMPVHDLLNHALKHIYDFLAGDTVDPDNLAGAAWGLFAAMHSQEMWGHLNAGHLRGPGCEPPAKCTPPEREDRHATEEDEQLQRILHQERVNAHNRVLKELTERHNYHKSESVSSNLGSVDYSGLRAMARSLGVPLRNVIGEFMLTDSERSLWVRDGMPVGEEFADWAIRTIPSLATARYTTEV